MTGNDIGIRKLLGRLYRQISSRQRRRLIIIVVMMVVGAVLEVMTLGAVLPFLAFISTPDRAWNYLNNAGVHSLLGYTRGDDLTIAATSIFILVAVVSGAMRIILAWASNQFVFAVGRELSTKLFTRTLYQNYSFHLARNTSHAIANLTEIRTLTTGTLVPIMQAATALIIGLFIVVSLIVIDPGVAIGTIACFGLMYFAMTFLFRQRLLVQGQSIGRLRIARIKTVQESLGGIRDVMLDNTHPIFVSSFVDMDRKIARAQAMNVFVGAAPRFVAEAAGMVLIAAVAMIFSMREGGLIGALPVLAALALGAQRLLPLMQQGYNAATSLLGNLHVVDNVLRALERPIPLDYQLPAPLEPLPFGESIKLENVSFRHQPDQADVLVDFSFTIQKGARIGLLGKTGSGKSTTADLIMGLLEPWEGSIKIDGVELVRSNRRAWHKQIAHVPQMVFLSDSSIVENIAFGIPLGRVEMERVRDAARKAQIADYIETLPDGYDTMVGERGVRLSGGQRQRIGIARALYKDASILVLDEATSALDTETEMAIIQAIAALDRDLTIITIAHRLSTLASCDQLVQLADGRITRIGTYEEVVGRAEAGRPDMI